MHQAGNVIAGFFYPFIFLRSMAFRTTIFCPMLVKTTGICAAGAHCCTAQRVMLIAAPKTKVSVSRRAENGITAVFLYVVMVATNLRGRR